MQQYSSMATSYMLDDSGPRPPPRFLRPPAITYEDKPVPLVPDVSLIFNSPLNNNRYNLTTPASTLTTPTTNILANGSPDPRMYPSPQYNLLPSNDPSPRISPSSQSNSSPNSDPRMYPFSQNNSLPTYDPRMYPSSHSNSAPNYPNSRSHSLPGNDPRMVTKNHSLPTPDQRMYSNSQNATPTGNANHITTDRAISTTLSSHSPSSTESVSSQLLQELVGMVKRQGTIIERMDLQLQALVTATLKESNEKKSVEKEAQTEREQESPNHSSRTDNPQERPKSKSRKKVKSGSESSVSASSSSSRKSNSPQSSTTDTSCNSSDSKKKEAPREKKKVETIAKPAADESIRENSQDLSTILRELQLPTIQEQSIYSADNSIRYIDFDSANTSKTGSPGMETSASLYCTSSDDEDGNNENVVQPTATFYRNVIGNVNRLLENNDTSPPAPRHRTKKGRGHHDPIPTDTTIYGMTSNNLSFATRQYLQRHGLVNSHKDDCGGGEARQAPQRFFPNPCNPYHPQYPPDRILDLTTLKNQPKLM